MAGMLEVCFLAIPITLVIALPAVPIIQGPWDSPGISSLSLPILQGPWNTPAMGSSWVVSGSSLALSTSPSTPSVSTLLNSSSSTSRSIITFPTSSSQRYSLSSSNPTSKSSPSSLTVRSTSVLSLTTKSSASSAGSASRTPSVAGIQSTKLLTASSIISSQLPNMRSVPPTPQGQSLSIGSSSSRLPSSTVTGNHTQAESKTASQPPHSTGSKMVSSSASSASSTVAASSVSSTFTTSPVSSKVAASSFATSSVVASSTLVPPFTITNTSAVASASSNACGAVAQYYNPTPKDWTDHNTDAWLNTWVNNNVGPIAANVNGFTGAFATWAVGNPDFSCRDDGSTDDCDFNPCNIAILNAKGDDLRQTYYIMESLVRIHTYFTGLREAFTVSAIGAALSKDGWAETFYKDKDDKSVIALREVLNALAMTVGIVCALSGLGGLVVGTIAAVSATLYNGAAGSFTPTIGMHVDNTFQTSADLGRVLGDIVVGTIESFTSANNILMHGQNYQGTGDLRDYWRGGGFVDYPGVDKNAVVNSMNGFLVGQAINQLYRRQKIFIMGGGACGDNQGIGEGPQGYSVCRDGKAWYLYWWEENNVISLTMHQWGWVSPPPGSDQLGHGDYAAVTVQDIINSSLDAYIVAGYNYNNVTAYQRAQSAIANQWANPAAQGPAWEGVFTIPVCNVSQAINSDYYDKDWILQDYGHDSRPVWCGPICDGNIQKTKDFISAANMENFQSPTHLCDDDTEANWWMGI